MSARGRKKSTTRQKDMGSKRSQKTWPTDDRTSNIREPDNNLAVEEKASSSSEQLESSESLVGNTLVDRNGLKNEHPQEDGIKESLSNEESKGAVYSSTEKNSIASVLDKDVIVSTVQEYGTELNVEVHDDMVSLQTSQSQIGTGRETEPGTEIAMPIIQDEITFTDPQREEIRLSAIKLLCEKVMNDESIFFLYPDNPKAGAEVDLFFNRSLSTLSQESSIKVRGAYNDWKWCSFEENLMQTSLPGDWWSCKLQVPKEAYKIDFVFHNGGSLYENNKNKDFSVPVEDGMKKDDFEDFLIEEERKELERIAAEKALEERRIAEQRRLAEKVASEEIDRHEAIKRVNEQRERTSRVLQRAVKYAEGLWYFQPSEFQGGDTVKLFYNRSNRSLGSSKEVWIHGGYNNWQDMVSVVGHLTFFSAEDGDWWTIDVDVPKQAFVLNWVLADGPPEAATIYDNNGYQDFHALVPKGVPNDLYWREMEDRAFHILQEERQKREEAIRKKAEHTAQIKEELKRKTKTILVKSREHIFYTDPIDVKAGKEVTVFYNPANTSLNGKPEVWLLASFNRWTHRRGPVPPVQMLPVTGTTLLKCSIKVPLDAYMMDFVFSERLDGGGIFDNNLGKDYHVPVIGGSIREPTMKVVHISVEMAPVAKVGGLGDVVTSLSRAIQDLGHSVEVILPKYDCLKYNHIHNLQEKESFFWGNTMIRVWNGTVEGLPVIFLEPENGMFWAGCVYGRRDDGHRFGFFCHAALEYLLRSGRRPDIIHCHDWSSAPVSWLFKEQYKQSNLADARVVFTIHNLEFGTALIGKAMAFADKATTVSETYASEVSGNPAIAPHLSKFCGIRNGIDLDIWDPYNDPYIPLPYSSENVAEGKKAAKKELQSKLGLSQTDRPLVGIITRLTAQKGIHLIKHAIWRTLDRNGQVVLLGSAPDPRIQNDFSNLANDLHNSRGDMARLCLHYDEPLSHLIYAAADFTLIPSMFEPCGLTQLIAMRYGSIPVVRRTGGLNDTVFDVDHDRERAAYHGIEPNGFSFDGTDPPAVDYALNRGLSAWYDARDWFNDLCRQVMEQDWSWNRPALDYIELYHNARK
ncbi:hypothetical protein KP509_18G020900 [Ceratopteris richardii]|nr:hypothetical protein KP509_18G020900 [Ceratopteris richardii]